MRGSSRMNTPAILDADMATVGRWLRTGFDWWKAELRSMVPSWLRERLNPPPAVIAHCRDDKLLLMRRGAVLLRVPAGQPVTLALAAGSALAREIRLPRLSPSDIALFVDIEAERLLPFAPGTVLLDFSVGPGDSSGGQPVTVAGLPIGVANAAMALAASDALDVRRLRIEIDNGLAFDFLPAWQRANKMPDRSPHHFWWGAVGLAFLCNLTLLIGLDVHNLDETRALVEAHGQAAQTARMLRARVTDEAARRHDLAIRRQAQNPLPILAETARALPDSVWVQRLAWDGNRLRIGGYKPASVDVVGAMRQSPLFSDVRSSASDVPAQLMTGQPYELTAERRR